MMCNMTKIPVVYLQPAHTAAHYLLCFTPAAAHHPSARTRLHRLLARAEVSPVPARPMHFSYLLSRRHAISSRPAAHICRSSPLLHPALLTAGHSSSLPCSYSTWPSSCA